LDRFHSLNVFAKVVEKGGFAAAARALNISPPAVTRAVSMLEDHLGTRLLTRTTRSISLTEGGRRFLEDSKRILHDLEEAEAVAQGIHAKPRGELCVTAPMLFGRLFVAPLLMDFLDKYPELNAKTLFVDRVVSLMDEGLDVGIRIGELPDSSLIAVRCGNIREVVVASPDYLTEHGTPNHPDELQKHRLIQSVGISNAPDWKFVDRGKLVAVKISPRVRANTNDTAVTMCESGWGLSRLYSYQVAQQVTDRRLQIVLGDFEPANLPIHVVHQEGRMVSGKVRAFVDYAVDHMRSDPQLH